MLELFLDPFLEAIEVLEDIARIAHDHTYNELPPDYKVPVAHREKNTELRTSYRLIAQQSRSYEFKKQFIIHVDESNPLISSFGVACIEELNPDGSPVDKRHSSFCAVHAFSECPDVSGDIIENGDGIENECPDVSGDIENSGELENEYPDVSGDFETSDIEFIMKLMKDVSKRKNPSLQCEVCEKKFTAPTSLKTHYLRHLNLKPFPCSVCKESFTRRTSLEYHMLIHTKQFRFTCPECLKRFRHPTHFKNHCQGHKAEKIQCTKCPSVFKNKGTLQRHQRAKHREVLKERNRI